MSIIDLVPIPNHSHGPGVAFSQRSRIAWISASLSGVMSGILSLLGRDVEVGYSIKQIQDLFQHCPQLRVLRLE